MVTLRAALGLGDRDVVAFVGAGGKTTAMFRLARELHAGDATVVVTTTTKIVVPPDSSDLRIVIEPRRSALRATVAEALGEDRIPVVATAVTAEGKLAGLPSEWIADLAELARVTHVLIEADGAARKPFKAPREGEPVIPRTATLVIAVVGIDALGERLSEVTHRPERVIALTGMGAEDRLDARTMARVLLDPRGISKGTPPSARVVSLLNKADDAKRLGHARELATVLRLGGAQRIVIASLDAADAVIEVHEA